MELKFCIPVLKSDPIDQNTSNSDAQIVVERPVLLQKLNPLFGRRHVGSFHWKNMRQTGRKYGDRAVCQASRVSKTR